LIVKVFVDSTPLNLYFRSYREVGLARSKQPLKCLMVSFLFAANAGRIKRDKGSILRQSSHCLSTFVDFDASDWPCDCEDGPIFDPLRPNFKERLRSATPRFGRTSHATSVHEVLYEEADSINRFRRLHCYALINRDTNGAGEAKMQWRDAIKSAGVLVLASD
jgi:hypothetical protein